MKAIKRFDCVEMKNAIQSKLVMRRSGMSPEEFIADVEISLKTSKDPIGQYWRSICLNKRQSSRRSALSAT